MNPPPTPRAETDPRFVKLLFLATILLFLPIWLWLSEAWLSNPYYSHGPLVILVSLYFAWAHRTRAGDASYFKPNNLGWLVPIAALALHLWATLWRAYYLSALMIPLTFGALLATLWLAHRAQISLPTRLFAVDDSAAACRTLWSDARKLDDVECDRSRNPRRAHRLARRQCTPT